MYALINVFVNYVPQNIFILRDTIRMLEKIKKNKSTSSSVEQQKNKLNIKPSNKKFIR